MRQKKIVFLAALLVFLAGFSFSIRSAGAAVIQETQITADLNAQGQSAIYGDKIVYVDNRNGNFDIYLYDLATKQEKQITTDPSKQIYPVIYANKIVWTDARNGAYDIYMYDLTTNTETQITSDPSFQLNPDIYEDIIVWEDSRNGNYDIYMYDIKTGQEKQITFDVSDQQRPRIYGDKIIWTDVRNGTRDIYMYDLTAGLEVPLVVDATNKANPNIYKNTVIWYELFDDYTADVYTYDISTAIKTRITSSPYDEYNPHIYEDKIVWYDTRNGNSDIFLYDISTGQQTQVTSDPNYQAACSIYQNTIVWDDTRNGNPDVYMATVYFTPEITSVDPQSVKVGDTVTIKGKGFGYTQGDSQVKLANGTACTVKSWSNDSITCQIPQGAATGLLKVVTKGGESSGIMITVSVPLPAAPSGLAASAANAGKINLGWKDNSTNEEGFTIERSTNGTTFKAIAVTNSNATTYADTGLAQNTTYYYRVCAYNADGNSSYSNTAQAKTLKEPSISSLSRSSGLINDTVQISGTSFGAKSTYSKVQFCLNGVSTDAAVSTWSDTGITFNVPRITVGIYSVKVVNSVGESNAASFSVILPPLPVLTSLSVTKAYAGTILYIYGYNFGPITPLAKIQFYSNNACGYAQIIGWNNNMAICKVPYLPDGYYQIRVINRGVVSRNYADFKIK